MVGEGESHIMFNDDFQSINALLAEMFPFTLPRMRGIVQDVLRI
jgi:hypothetical protein